LSAAGYASAALTDLSPMTPSSPSETAAAPDADLIEDDDDGSPACVMVFNASDPSGASGIASDVTAVASVGAHALPVVTGAYARDTAEIFDHFAFESEAVSEQARVILEDVPVQVFKVGFVGTPENLSAIAEIATDYADVPLIAYMPNLSWWQEGQIDLYLDAFRELMLPQTTVLVGNHSTLWRWLLPDWSSERSPGPRDIAKAAGELGVPYTLVTGIPLPDQFIDNVLASPQSVLASEKFERFEAVFSGAGDTLSAALAALVAGGSTLPDAVTEALSYLDRCLDSGFRPGMGNVLPDRLFWAQSDDTPDAATDTSPDFSDFEIPPHETKH
jgi:hydroxymethylpyrimidine/phosphomethylpyrimidine kinase